MPYTMSVITEIMRVGQVAGATPAHRAKEDVTVCGQRIPKGWHLAHCMSKFNLKQPISNLIAVLSKFYF